MIPKIITIDGPSGVGKGTIAIMVADHFGFNYLDSGSLYRSLALALSEENIDIEIIDLRTIRPLDIETIIKSVKKTNRLLIVEEAWPFGNVSTEISHQIQNKCFDYLDAPIEKLNTADTPAPYSPVLLAEWLPNQSDVIKSVKKVLYQK